MNKEIIKTEKAPAAIGTYSQAVKVNNRVYLSGQIGMDPVTMQLVFPNFKQQAHQVFKNMAAVCEAAGGSLADLVKVNIYLLDMGNFSSVNEVMAEYFAEPYPARAAVAVKQLPKDADIEIEGIMVI